MLAVSACAPRERPIASGPNGVVVSNHRLASEVGLHVLQEGGNAIDAAIAVGFALGVVDQFNSGIGGGGFVLIRLADGTVYAIDGREAAPAASVREMFLEGDSVNWKASRMGPRAVGVPGLLAAYERALALAGTRTLAELIAPALTIAENGFTIGDAYYEEYSSAAEELRNDPASRAIYFREDGSLLQVGDTLRQPDLVATYLKIASGGSDYFYRGEFARRMEEFMRGADGLITRSDMATYDAVVREPLVIELGNAEVIGMPPPSSGGVHVAQILQMAEASGIARGRRWSADGVYWMTRFMKEAFEDRALHLGDPDFYPIPVAHLISASYADSVVAEVMSSGAVPFPRGEEEELPDIAMGHTTNFCVVDRWGNAVSVNQTVNLTYGAKITLPGTGVVLNDQMDDFSIAPGVPNAFGLIGSEANAIAPGKRPLSSMAPTIVMAEDEEGTARPVLLLGGAGGPRIITAIALAMIQTGAFEKRLEEALAAPRFHHQFLPDVIFLEKTAPRSWARRLGRRWGAQTEIADYPGTVHGIEYDPENGTYVGVPDPRSGGWASAY